MNPIRSPLESGDDSPPAILARSESLRRDQLGSWPVDRHPAFPDLPAPIAILGVPFTKVSTQDTLRIVGEMIRSRRPHYAATANVDFVVQSLGDVELHRILSDADIVLCDGTPLVWASRLLGNPLPERVAGSDLVPSLLDEAECQGWRIFFLGGTETSVARAAENVRARHPGLFVVGAYSPPFRSLLEMDHAEIVHRVREAKPDILLVAFGCPKQEKWINMHFRDLEVPFCIGVGATIDFLAGTVRRAPRWMRPIGLEWTFRLAQEPQRLLPRYANDLRVFGGAILRQFWTLRARRNRSPQGAEIRTKSAQGGRFEVVSFPTDLDARMVDLHAGLWTRLVSGSSHLLLELSEVQFIDSTGVGLLLRFQQCLRSCPRHLVLLAPSPSVLRALDLMGLHGFFTTVPNLSAAFALVDNRVSESKVVAAGRRGQTEGQLAWQGEVVASNVDEVWRNTRMYLERLEGTQEPVNVSLEGVRFIDSTGVSLMIRVLKESRRREINLRFIDPQPRVQNVLRILRMETFLLR